MAITMNIINFYEIKKLGRPTVGFTPIELLKLRGTPTYPASCSARNEHCQLANVICIIIYSLST